VNVVTTHPPVPFSPHFANVYQAYIRTLGQLRKQMQGPVVLIGDLNTTPWSAHYRQLLMATQLHDARTGFGIRPTWPTYFPVFFIPIDHVYVSPDLIPITLETGNYNGSDHLPIYTELRVLGLKPG
jgi:endonuclease/exonuclease/phosphatase (EEP) superfamily protein YafD